MDTSPPVAVRVSTVPPKLAVHITFGNVTATLQYDDENSFELVQGQQITLAFLLPNNGQDTLRDFIFYTDGYYCDTVP